DQRQADAGVAVGEADQRPLRAEPGEPAEARTRGMGAGEKALAAEDRYVEVPAGARGAVEGEEAEDRTRGAPHDVEVLVPVELGGDAPGQPLRRGEEVPVP